MGLVRGGEAIADAGGQRPRAGAGWGRWQEALANFDAALPGWNRSRSWLAQPLTPDTHAATMPQGWFLEHTLFDRELTGFRIDLCSRSCPCSSFPTSCPNLFWRKPKRYLPPAAAGRRVKRSRRSNQAAQAGARNERRRGSAGKRRGQRLPPSAPGGGTREPLMPTSPNGVAEARRCRAGHGRQGGGMVWRELASGTRCRSRGAEL